MMKYKGYFGRVEFDPEARILAGEVIGIRDVITFQGRSVAEVEKAFRESVEDYLTFCKERGEEPDKPCSGKFVVRIDSTLHRRASLAAESTGKSLNTLVAESLQHTLAERFPTRTSARRKTATNGRTGRQPKIPKFR